VHGLSIQVLASNLSALNCSVVEDVIKSGTPSVDDSADILARRASTTLAGGLCASMSGLDSEMVTGPSCDFGGTALQAVVTVNGLSSPVTTSSLSGLSWSFADVCVALFYSTNIGKSLCTVQGLHRERAKGDAPTIRV
jgi:hypothetical protein